MDSNQVMTQNGFLKFDSSRLTTQKLQNILIKINSESWLKKALQNFDSNRLMTQNPIWNIDSNQVMTQWFESTVDFVDLFLVFTQFRWPFRALTKFRSLFLGFHYILLTFFGWFDSSATIRISLWLKRYLEDLNRFNSWLKRLSKNWLRINSWLKWIPQVLIQIDSWLKVFPHFFDSNQLMNQAKNIWFWFDLWFESES